MAHPFGSEKLKINSMDMVRIRPREISKFANCPRLTARLEDEKLQKYFNLSVVIFRVLVFSFSTQIYCDPRCN